MGPRDQIGDRIKRRREELGMSQSHLARRADLTPSAIWQYEQGERRPSSEALKKLADALKVATDFLLGVRDPTWEDLMADKDLRRMFRGLESLSEKDKERLLDFYSLLKQRQNRA